MSAAKLEVQAVAPVWLTFSSLFLPLPVIPLLVCVPGFAGDRGCFTVTGESGVSRAVGLAIQLL